MKYLHFWSALYNEIWVMFMGSVNVSHLLKIKTNVIPRDRSLSPLDSERIQFVNGYLWIIKKVSKWIIYPRNAFLMLRHLLPDRKISFRSRGKCNSLNENIPDWKSVWRPSHIHTLHMHHSFCSLFSSLRFILQRSFPETDIFLSAFCLWSVRLFIRFPLEATERLNQQ